jgi:magnesium transporter
VTTKPNPPSRSSADSSVAEGAGAAPAAADSSRGTASSLRAWSWSPAGFAELDSVDGIERAYAEPQSRVWVDVEAPTAELLADLGECLKLHPLTIEDIVERNQRAKIEQQTEDTVHLVMFALLYDGEVVSVEVDIVLGGRFLLTSRGPEWDPLESQHLRQGVERMLKEGPDFVLYGVVDHLVDGYFPVFDRLGDEIDQLQADVIGRPNQFLIERLLQLRRDLLAIRHAVLPQREIFNQLTTRDIGLVRDERIAYFRDVYDHLIRLTDELDSFRELVTGTLDAYLTTVNNNLSEVMKRLTAATVVLAGVGAIAGIFGMSEAAVAFRFEEASGFWIITAFVIMLGAGALIYFRRIGWL